MRKFCIRLAALAILSSGLCSCDTVVSKIIKKSTSGVTSEVAEKVAKEAAEEGLEKSGKRAASKAAKEVAGEAIEKAGKSVAGKTLKEMATSNKNLAILYEDFSRRISREFADGITVKSTKQGLELVSKDFPNSAIKITNNVVIGKGGSLANSGPVNEFLNKLLPNKTYIIDDAFVYKTDDLGRVISCSADRSKAFKSISRNTQRNSDIQEHIVKSLDGKAGLDDGGHLFANSTGGPNELINQVPMSKKLNRNGQWRELERLEEDALKQGKKVTSERKLLYRGSEKRPYAIEFTTKIDGKTTTAIVENID